MLTSLCQTPWKASKSDIRKTDEPLLHCFLSNRLSQSWKRVDQRRGQLGITTVYGAEFQTEKGLWF